MWKKHSFKTISLLGSMGLFLASVRAQSLSVIGKWPGDPQTSTNTVAVAKVDVQGNFAYLANGVGGLQILDVSNPANPLPVGEYKSAAAVRDVSVSGTNALIIGDGIQILDVSNPNSPRLLGSFQKATYQATSVGWWNEKALASFNDYGVVILDISNPAAPQEVTVVQGPYSSMATSGFGGIQTSSSFLAFVNSGGLETRATFVDLRNGAQGSWGVLNWVTSAALNNGIGCVWTTKGGLKVLDIHDLNAITQVGEISALGRVPPAPAIGGMDGALTQSGNIVVVSTYPAVYVVDVTLPSAPKELGRYQTRSLPNRATVRGTLAFVPEGPGGFEIIDFGPVLPPTVGISRAGQQTILQIGGKVGKQHAIETSSSLDAGATWSRLPSFTLTQPNQPVPVTATTNTFYRVVEEP